jgi:hypothetical protein
MPLEHYSLDCDSLFQISHSLILSYNAILEHAVAQLVEALLYKPESIGLDPRWRHWNFSLN